MGFELLTADEPGDGDKDAEESFRTASALTEQLVLLGDVYTSLALIVIIIHVMCAALSLIAIV